MIQDRILFMGDSHAARAALRARALYPTLKVAGGNFLGIGQTPRRDFFQFENGVLRFADPDVQAQFLKFAQEGGVDSGNLLDLDMPIALSTLGVDRIVTANAAQSSAEEPLFLSRQLAEAVLQAAYRELLRFLSLLKDAGKNLVYILGPGMRSNGRGEGQLFLALRELLLRELDARGLAYVDVTTKTCDNSGVLLRHFWPDDPEDLTHGNEAWAELVVEGCLRHFGMKADTIGTEICPGP